MPGYVPRDTISWENGIFAQDDWRAMPNLTLNLGLRWDLLTPYYEKNNKIANYDPATQTLVLPGNGVPRSTLNTNHDNFGPRVGFDYLLNDRTAFRGGYGIFYSLDRGGIDRQPTENPPAVLTEFRFGSDPGANVKLSEPIPLPDPVNPKNPVLPLGSGLVYVPRDSKNTKVQQWNVGVQREIDRNTSAMVAYVGTRGDNLATEVTSAGFGGGVADRLSTVMYIGSSKYDALQMSLRRRESNGLSYLASYTYGNAKNDGPGYYGGSVARAGSITDSSCVKRGTTDCNLSLDYGRADYDARHRFTLAATYALPFAKDNVMIGGWNVNTVVTLQTGTPLTVYDYDGNRADMTANANSGSHKADKWFNTSAFTPCVACKQSPGPGVQGTEPRNPVTGPPTRTIDLSLFKTFSMPRYGALELRLEGFNIFNWAQYNQPDNIVGGFTKNPDGTLTFNRNSNFGKITGTRLNSERQVQLGVRYIY